MDDQVTTTCCLTDDFLQYLRHREPADRTVSDAEVLTVALVAARFFRGNGEAAWRFLTEYRYMPRRLSRSQYRRASARPRRLHAAAPLLGRLFEALAELWKTVGAERVSAVDSVPVACCDNARTRRSRLYPLAETDGAFRGYQSPPHLGGVASGASSTGSGGPAP